MGRSVSVLSAHLGPQLGYFTGGFYIFWRLIVHHILRDFVFSLVLVLGENVLCLRGMNDKIRLMYCVWIKLKVTFY